MSTQHTIVPHLWFDREAKEAAAFYTSIFPEAAITHTGTLHDTPSGDCDVVSFQLAGQPFMAISAGPRFDLNPSVSFMVSFTTKEEVDSLWAKLSDGGKALMPLDSYPFSDRYGWIQDRFGVSWQIIRADAGEEPWPTIVPSLLFVGDNCGRAEDAIRHYTSVFRGSKIGAMHRYPDDQQPDGGNLIMFADFMLEGQWLAAMDSADEHDFTFNEALSFMVKCETQEEIDYYWEALSAVPEAEQCGWLKDRYGLSWQVVPAVLDEMLASGSPEQTARVTEAFLQMKKFDLAELQRAYEGEAAARQRV